MAKYIPGPLLSRPTERKRRETLALLWEYYDKTTHIFLVHIQKQRRAGLSAPSAPDGTVGGTVAGAFGGTVDGTVGRTMDSAVW